MGSGAGIFSSVVSIYEQRKCQRPKKMCSIADRFKTLEKERFATVKKKLLTSGIEEKQSDLDNLLESLIEEVDDKERIKKEEKGIKKKKDKALRDQDKTIRNVANHKPRTNVMRDKGSHENYSESDN